jgi:uncharacterized protein (DUF1499 family)
MQIFLWAALAGVVFLALYASVKGRKQVWASLFGPVRREAVDFEKLTLAPSPNQYLVCPPGLCSNAKANAASPLFDMPPDQLRERWMERIGRLPLVEEIDADPALEQYSFEVLTPLMHFPDTVVVRFLPGGEGKSTLAIYSRSHYGYGDMGANEKRVKQWLELLSR